VSKEGKQNETKKREILEKNHKMNGRNERTGMRGNKGGKKDRREEEREWGKERGRKKI
jgi:hypothetical protein